MTELVIRESVLSDVRALSKNLRTKDRLELENLGLPVYKAIYFSYHLALTRTTALIDGEVAAMWGLHGTPLGTVGTPYLLTTPLSEKISSLQFSRIYKREVQKMKELFPSLENHVDASYEEAIKLLKLAGFTVEDPAPYGKKNKLFCKFRMVNK